VRGIYNGTYTNWNQVGGSDQEIVVVGRDSASDPWSTFLEA
jgi:phosphate transport system substrate-binding protein